MAAIFLQALKHKDKFPEAFETIAKASLVDNMTDSRPTKKHMEDLVTQLIGFFPLCPMEIRKFISNSHHIMKDLKSDLRIKDLQNDELYKMLQELHTLYDPMGILIPFLVTGKLLVQSCWKLGLTWQDHVPQDIKEQWLKWQNQISEFDNIKIKRVLIPGGNTRKQRKTVACVYGRVSRRLLSGSIYAKCWGKCSA
jgi:hypothetical protein